MKLELCIFTFVRVENEPLKSQKERKKTVDYILKLFTFVVISIS